MYQDNLQSDRLITRKLTESDILIWADFFADEEAIQFFPTFGLTSNIEKAKHMIDKQLERYMTTVTDIKRLLTKKTNSFIGLCGLLTQNIEGKTEIEIGYHIFKKHWGQGYAPEAAKLFIDYAFKNNLATSVISVIDVGNIQSQKVAEKNGLTIEKQTKWLDNEDVYIYRINKDKWK